jgi:carbonic anhydrase
MISAQEALARLQDGNRRFVAGLQNEETRPNHLRRALTAEEQSPFAIILGCSDSRVPTEIVFDQGLGDLFVIRVAGNIVAPSQIGSVDVAPSQIGSVEFAASKFGTPLVVVLGHSQCGAILATLDYLREPTAHEHSVNSRSIVERIRPAVEKLVDSEKPDMVWQAAVRANVKASVDQLRHGSRILEQLIDDEELQIVGAEYSLQTGAVEFL